jgi:predicted DNA-binding protein (MmcQ/YjbR family)
VRPKDGARAAGRRRSPRAPLLRLCRRLPGATEDVKWGHDLVFSVGGKMFAAFDLEPTDAVAFKVSPPLFASLIHRRGIRPAPYAARHHWVLVESGDALPLEVLGELLREAHALVAEKLPRRLRRELGLEPAPAPGGKRGKG